MSERKMPSVEDYPSNAIGDSKPKDKEKPIVRGSVKKKTSIFRSVRDEFISEDAPTMGEYLIHDILFPALRDLINDICHGAVDAAFGSGNGYRSRDRGRRGGSYISYNRYYDDRSSRSRRERDDERRETRRMNQDVQDFIFEYREDAEDVLDRMCDKIEDYGEVTLAYFYDITGQTVPGNWTAEDWGWTNLSGARVRGGGRRGYVLDLPRVKAL